ncbi:MAG: sigma-70 family RNA polymerase sigma factor, partial [Myxococcales bacterium]
MDLDGRFFRREAGRLTAALTRLFGVQNLALAEDVTQDALCRAVEVWKFRGPPPNPSAWLMATAKNRAIDVLRRERTARTFAPELGRWLETEWTLRPTVDALFAVDAIQDDQLRMMLSCCHPRLPEEAQLAVILQVLCGFSVKEIASALLESPAAVEKRVTRAKKALAASRTLFDLGDARELEARLPVVHRALYLLFNEGYHGASPESAVRVELCHEAMRLVSLLLDHPVGQTPATRALAALMCLHAARMPGRLDGAGELTPFFEQDRSQWDQTLIVQGRRLLDQSATGPDVTTYHLEAAIAGVHAMAPSARQTDWSAIVRIYDALLALRPSPVVALHRAIALGQHQGPDRGLEAIGGIAGSERLERYPFYAAAMGEMELARGRTELAWERFHQALGLARNPTERRFLEKRL